jgi:hypothetical protein
VMHNMRGTAAPSKAAAAAHTHWGSGTVSATTGHARGSAAHVICAHC